MKRVVRIDRATGEVTVESNPGMGIRVTLELPNVSVEFGLNAEASRTLGGALIQAAKGLGPDEEGDRGDA
jgi:hypothetical protein